MMVSIFLMVLIRVFGFPVLNNATRLIRISFKEIFFGGVALGLRGHSKKGLTL